VIALQTVFPQESADRLARSKDRRRYTKARTARLAVAAQRRAGRGHTGEHPVDASISPSA
jgi:hypothetical protein